MILMFDHYQTAFPVRHSKSEGLTANLAHKHRRVAFVFQVFHVIYMHPGVASPIVAMSTGTNKFSVMDAVVTSGGPLVKPWMPEVKTACDKKFMLLTHTSRELARAMSMNMHARAPLKECTLFGYLERARDDAVDALIRSYKQASDPMGEDIDVETGPITTKRATWFEDASVPEVIEISLPYFIANDGERVNARTMFVITTPKRGVLINIEATAANLEWCSKAIAIDWDSQRRSKQTHTYEGLPTLEYNHVIKYRRIGDRLCVQCKYAKKDGTVTVHKRTVVADLKDLPPPEQLRQQVRSAELLALEFYRKNHNIRETSTSGEASASAAASDDDGL